MKTSWNVVADEPWHLAPDKAHWRSMKLQTCAETSCMSSSLTCSWQWPCHLQCITTLKCQLTTAVLLHHISPRCWCPVNKDLSQHATTIQQHTVLTFCLATVSKWIFLGSLLYWHHLCTITLGLQAESWEFPISVLISGPTRHHRRT